MQLCSREYKPCQKILTLGSINKRKQFTYSGRVSTGVTFQFSGKPHTSPGFFKAIFNQFDSETIAGGFSMTDPTPGSLGQWIVKNSKQLNSVSLTPRYASFKAAVLVHEKFITSSLKRNAIYLHFGHAEDKLIE